MNEPDRHTPDPSDPTRGERFREAAIAAELETGEREPTRQKAWRSSMLRLVRMGFGFSVVVLGIIMMPLPGPGMLVVAVGLAILARDAAWADRLMRKVRERLPSDADGKLPRSDHRNDGSARRGGHRRLHLVHGGRHQPVRRDPVLARLIN